MSGGGRGGARGGGRRSARGFLEVAAGGAPEEAVSLGVMNERPETGLEEHEVNRRILPVEIQSDMLLAPGIDYFFS